MDTVHKEIRCNLSKVMSKVAFALMFWAMSHVALVTLNGISAKLAFLLHIGLLLAAGMFPIKTFYRITEKKANSVANRISNSNIDEGKINGK